MVWPWVKKEKYTHYWFTFQAYDSALDQYFSSPSDPFSVRKSAGPCPTHMIWFPWTPFTTWEKLRLVTCLKLLVGRKDETSYSPKKCYSCNEPLSFYPFYLSNHYGCIAFGDKKNKHTFIQQTRWLHSHSNEQHHPSQPFRGRINRHVATGKRSLWQVSASVTATWQQWSSKSPPRNAEQKNILSQIND